MTASDDSRSLAEVGGIEVTGVDLSVTLDESYRNEILGLFRKHPILVFRDQRLTKQQQYAFATNFGEIEEWHDGEGKPSGLLPDMGNDVWHSDKSYHAVPSLLTMLHAAELPLAGGETQFANAEMAYDELNPTTKHRIRGLRAVHSWEASRIQSGSPPATAAQMAERPPVEHPLVRVHPDTGRLALYLGNHACHVVGMNLALGKALLRSLLDHTTHPSFVYAHAWRPGDLVAWDNRCMLHRALWHPGMDLHRRVLHRTVVKGSVPVAP